ncbi:MAG: STAS domain-containing protein [Streptosporangiaceae bacterium]
MAVGLVPGLAVTFRAECGYTIAALTGKLDLAAAPALREQLWRILRPAASRLVIDLSAVSHADVSGLTVMVGTGRRARLLGGFLRLAAPAPAVTGTLQETGLSRHFDVYPTVGAAISGAALAASR